MLLPLPMVTEAPREISWTRLWSWRKKWGVVMQPSATWGRERSPPQATRLGSSGKRTKTLRYNTTCKIHLMGNWEHYTTVILCSFEFTWLLPPLLERGQWGEKDVVPREIREWETDIWCQCWEAQVSPGTQGIFWLLKYPFPTHPFQLCSTVQAHKRVCNGSPFIIPNHLDRKTLKINWDL